MQVGAPDTEWLLAATGRDGQLCSPAEKQDRAWLI